MSKATIPVLAERLNHTFAAGTFDLPHGLTIEGSRIWACAQMVPCQIVRFNNPADLTDNTILSCPLDSQHDGGLDILYDGNVNDRMYVLHRNVDRTVISEVNPGTMARADAVNDTNHPNTNGSIVASTSHLFCGTYFGTVGSPSAPDAQILKWPLDDFPSKSTATLTNYKQCHALRFDGTNLFATGSVQAGGGPPWIARINPTTLAFTAVSLPSGIGYPTDDLAFYGNYVYVGVELANVGTILRIDKTTLAISTILVKPTTANFYGVFADATHIWAVTSLDAGQGKMIRLDPATLEQRLYTFNVGEVTDGPNEVVFISPYMFVTFFQNGAKISRLRIPTT